MLRKSHKIKFIFLFYWILLLYILSALIWWYVALSRQNDQMTSYKIALLKNDSSFEKGYNSIIEDKKRKTAQYIGEGSIFLLLITVGAIFLFKAIHKQLRISKQQQDFMIAITHELKTPIAVTKLNLETLQRRKLDELQEKKLISNSIEENNRMNDLCSNLLLSSQMEGDGYQIIFEKFNFTDLVRNCVDDFSKRFPQKNILLVDHEESFINGDIFLIKIVVNNLIDNSVKYTPKESDVKLSVFKHRDKIELHVADRGPGISDKDKREVFKKFYRTDSTKKTKGTGLGLFLVEKIIKLHKGIVYIRDNPPAGANFVIQLKRID